jgi:hypothetical protein
MSLVDWNGHSLLVVDGPWRRFFGALSRPQGAKGLLFKDCSAIHTHWGWPLSRVFFLDGEFRIVRVIDPVRFRFYFCPEAHHAVELF